jgi:hypothetical protein
MLSLIGMLSIREPDRFGCKIRAAGITAYGYAYSSFGWSGAVGVGTTVLLLALGIGLMEIIQERKWQLTGG